MFSHNSENQEKPETSPMGEKHSNTWDTFQHTIALSALSEAPPTKFMNVPCQGIWKSTLPTVFWLAGNHLPLLLLLMLDYNTGPCKWYVTTETPPHQNKHISRLYKPAVCLVLEKEFRPIRFKNSKTLGLYKYKHCSRTPGEYLH